MWLVFLLAALLMLIGGVGGSIIVKTRPDMVPPEAFQHLPLAENVAYSVGIAMCLFGVAMCYRKLRFVGRRRSGSGRSGRSRTTDLPKRRKEATAEPELGGEGEPPSEQATLLFADPAGGDDEPGTRKMRKIGRR